MIVVAGGTGRLGTLVVRRLRDRGLPVRVLTRDPARAAPLAADRVQVVVGDVRDPGTLVPAVADADVVVSCVQGFAGPGRGSPASVDRDGNANLIDAARPTPARSAGGAAAAGPYGRAAATGARPAGPGRRADGPYRPHVRPDRVGPALIPAAGP